MNKNEIIDLFKNPKVKGKDITQELLKFYESKNFYKRTPKSFEMAKKVFDI